ncbi:phage Gp37/Gp68 family protein [Mesorhizobium sp. M6A.T.Ca.TU.002.02.2.1]|nr:phage Gp37/Gp68 family protein [Mesorhizobium sp. M6A.T.Ca.TU.002.02.2.1]
MADKSAIEWTDATWNPIVGCSILTPGCTHCYAMGMAARIEAMTAALQAKGGTGAPHYNGTTRKVNGKAVWTGKLAMAPEHILTEPLTWRTPRRIFVNSMGDLFHEDVPDEWIDKVFAIMALAPQHTFQVLTKRAKRMREYLTGSQPDHRIVAAQTQLNFRIPQHYQWPHMPLLNVWLGVSAERQQEAEERVHQLIHTPAAIRFVSAEPLLGPLDFTSLCTGHYFIDALAGRKYHDAPEGVHNATEACAKVDWIIVGGESGAGARPMHPAWARSIRDQCATAGVPFFFKQWGEFAPAFGLDLRPTGLPWSGESQTAVARGTATAQQATRRFGKRRAGRLLDGIEHNAMPQAR